jgi:glutamate racemase
LKVGVFDSGIGGLTVAKSLLESHLFREIIYFGDTARVPYGSRDKHTIIRYSLEAVEFFKNFNIELLVVACNTVSAYALDKMREEADFPIVGVVESGILALQNLRVELDKKILVIGTKATIKSGAYQNRLRDLGYRDIESVATGLFVPIVEEGIFKGEVLDSTLNHYFSGVETPQYIILGCTHFPLIGDQISNFFNHSPQLIHSGEAIVQYLRQDLKLSKKEETKIEFFASENPTFLKSMAEKWLGIE